MTHLLKHRVLVALAALGSLAAAPAAARGEASDTASLKAFLRILRGGDQAGLQRYIERSFDPEALRTVPAGERADRLARLYVDSGGFRITRHVDAAPDREVAAAKARHTRLPYCLTLTSRIVDERERITDFAAVEMPLPASPVTATPEPREVARTLTKFMDRLARADAFSGVFLVAKDGQPFVRKAYGRADLANTPVTLDTRFNIASIGKMVTAVLIGQLVDQGRLSYDDKVGKFLPDYPDEDVREKVMVRHLLTHTSGLGDKSEFTASPLWPSARSRLNTLDDYIPLITGHPLENEPGTRYSYSNAGFVLLGKIIEKVSGRDFYDIAAANVFVPAGMRNSFYGEWSKHPKVAHGLTNFVFEGTDYVFRLGPKRDAGGDGATRGGAHGGASVTADDLLNFMTAVRTAKLTSAETARLLTTPQESPRAGDTKNSLGFEIMSQNGHTIIGHNGGDIGVSAFVYHFNDTGYTAVVLSNYDPRAIRVIARKVRGLLTRSVIGAAPPAKPTDCSA